MHIVIHTVENHVGKVRGGAEGASDHASEPPQLLPAPAVQP